MGDYEAERAELLERFAASFRELREADFPLPGSVRPGRQTAPHARRLSRARPPRAVALDALDPLRDARRPRRASLSRPGGAHGAAAGEDAGQASSPGF